MNEQAVNEFINTIIQGDAFEKLKLLPTGSARCCVTSPPYFGLRDYGTATWIGGNQSCDHIEPQGGSNPETSGKQLTSAGTRLIQYKETCRKCGAIRIDNQIGLEETPEQYVENLVTIFREVKRILTSDGTLWLNLGDSYWGGKGMNGNSKARNTADERGAIQSKGTPLQNFRALDGKHESIKPKDLIGIPWMAAFALRADGWYLRQDIIWHKPNPMPESVTDRCTKSHEYIFLLSKSAKYYYDNEAIQTQLLDQSILRLAQNIKEQKGSSRVPGKTNGNMKAVGRPHGIVRDRLLDYDSKEKELRPNVNRGEYEFEKDIPGPDGFANKKSVWTVTTKPFSEAHFATFPEDLIVDCIKAGSAEGDTILDPFMGAGTTALVARKLNRNFIGTELNPEYIEIANKRLKAELGLFL